MSEGGKILAGIVRELTKKVKPGVATEELDRLAESLIFSAKGGSASGGKSTIQCSFKGHQGYPNCLCASINEEIVHAVPSARRLLEGDIISLDLGIFYKGYHTDMAITLPVGKISPAAKNLIKVTKKALELGVKEVRPGNYFGDISFAIQKYVESQGFNAVKELCGHGIGKNLHEDPEILNYGKIGTGPKIKEGMAFCLEPMVTAGDWRIKKSQDGHGWETNDGSLSAHFEHTIVVTKSGAEILTVI